jgi:hypothetical protein
MLLTFGTPKKCIQARNTSFASFDMLRDSKMFWNIPKHRCGSNGMDASQHCYLKIVHSGPKHEFSYFYVRRLAKWSKTHPNINQSRMDASQLRYLEIVIQSRNTSIAYFYVSKVSETLWNTPKHRFRSNVVERMLLTFGTQKKCIQARNTSFASFDILRVSEMFWNTPKHHFGSNGVEWMFRNFATLK